MGSSASANRGEHRSNSLAVSESTRPRSSPSTSAEKRSDIPEASLRRRPNSSSSKVAPLINNSLADKAEEEQWKEKALNAEKRVKDYEEQLAALKATIQASEVTNSSLKEKLESNECNSSSVGNDSPVVGDDQRIEKLQKELDHALTQIKKIKAQYKRRVRQFNTQLAECKQERALESFDSKTTISRLKEDNEQLTEKIERLQRREDEAPVDNGSDAAVSVDDNRMTLILDLSSKVSEQESEIMRLREQMRKHHISSDDGDTLAGPSASSKLSSESRRTLDSSELHDASRIEDQFQLNGPLGSLLSNPRNDFSCVNDSTLGTTLESGGMSSYRSHWASSCYSDEYVTNGVAEESYQPSPSYDRSHLVDSSKASRDVSDADSEIQQASASYGRRRNARMTLYPVKEQVDSSCDEMPPVCK